MVISKSGKVLGSDKSIFKKRYIHFVWIFALFLIMFQIMFDNDISACHVNPSPEIRGV